MRNLDLLGTFLAVYRSGSITEAAGTLGLSQPAVSERISRLEVEIGEELLTRSSRGVAPTAAGERLASKVAQPIDTLRAAWERTSDDATGTVKIGGASDVVANRIVPALAPLTLSGVRLEFALGLAADLLDRLTAGDLDMVISSINPTSPAIRSRGLIDEEFVLVGAPSLARTIDPVRLDANPLRALAHLPLIAYDEQLSIVRRYYRSQFGQRPFNQVSLIIPDLRGILAAVVAGAGISALPRYLAEPALVNGSIELLHRPEEPPINTLHVAVRAHEPLTPAASRVITRLFDVAKTWPVF